MWMSRVLYEPWYTSSVMAASTVVTYVGGTLPTGVFSNVNVLIVKRIVSYDMSEDNFEQHLIPCQKDYMMACSVLMQNDSHDCSVHDRCRQRYHVHY